MLGGGATAAVVVAEGLKSSRRGACREALRRPLGTLGPSEAPAPLHPAPVTWRPAPSVLADRDAAPRPKKPALRARSAPGRGLRRPPGSSSRRLPRGPQDPGSECGPLGSAPVPHARVSQTGGCFPRPGACLCPSHSVTPRLASKLRCCSQNLRFLRSSHPASTFFPSGLRGERSSFRRARTEAIASSLGPHWPPTSIGALHRVCHTPPNPEGQG